MIYEMRIFLVMVMIQIFSGALVGAQTPIDRTPVVIKYLAMIPGSVDSTFVLSNPQAISADIDGNIYLADTGQNRLLKLNAKGKLLDSVGGFGWEHQQFDRPLDVSAKTGLDVFVADYNNERIERYDKDLNFISTLSSADVVDSALKFGFPSGVDLSRHGELFVCDTENNRILKVNSFGEPLLSFGDFNWGNGELQFPFKLYVSDHDIVYVADRESNQIVVFDYYGNYITRFGESILEQPGGLIWWHEFLLVADSGHDRVVVFNRNYELVFKWGSKGDKIGAFNNPADVTAWDDKVYVCDSNNNRVEIFQLHFDDLRKNQ